jgi:hypothetical protein
MFQMRETFDDPCGLLLSDIGLALPLVSGGSSPKSILKHLIERVWFSPLDAP